VNNSFIAQEMSLCLLSTATLAEEARATD